MEGGQSSQHQNYELQSLSVLHSAGDGQPRGLQPGCWWDGCPPAGPPGGGDGQPAGPPPP